MGADPIRTISAARRIVRLIRTVIVQDAHGKRTRWKVSGETVAVYHAEEVEEEEPETEPDAHDPEYLP